MTAAKDRRRPISRLADIAAVADFLADRYPARRTNVDLRTFPHALFAPAAAIALFVDRLAPELTAKPHLRLAILGTHGPDDHFDVVPYIFLADLLGTDQDVSVRACGPKSQAKRGVHVAKRAFSPRLTQMSLSRQTATRFLASHPPREFDLVVIFHPGAVFGEGWFPKSNHLLPLYGTNIPVMISAFHEIDLDVDRYVFRSHGVRCPDGPIANPFSVELSPEHVERGGRCRWADILWRARFPKAPPTQEHIGRRKREMPNWTRRKGYDDALVAGLIHLAILKARRETAAERRASTTRRSRPTSPTRAAADRLPDPAR